MKTAINNVSLMQHYPSIDFVIIGVNSAKTLKRCIESIRQCDYPPEKIRVIYADGGSTDHSVQIAGSIENVTVLELHPLHPTPGIGRNAGWRSGTSPFVQFLDSDTILDQQWPQLAIQAMHNNTETGAVRGYRREIHPEQSFYNWLGDLEWNTRPGECDSFGGDVLIRRTALEQSGGYDEELVGGEDPELSWRITQDGWKILMLDALMTRHDLAMLKTSQYLRRSYRSGYGFAAVQSRVGPTGSSFWKNEQRRILIKGGGFILFFMLCLPAAVLLNAIQTTLFCLVSLSAGTVLLLFPRLFKVRKFMTEHHLDRENAKKYAWHCSLVVLPQLFGIMRFYAGRFFNKPLQNKRNKLQTGLSTPTP
ncbi:MAG: glycosyltransferase family 2 protein [Prosthecochloris sp.]|uniref:glycosyltransferase n=1 Tax=Prosthecochloris sp. TaxID=290513 RepID=UPI00258E346B|nr:glycosyltransferase family A protein [Prosthecochloris sp.]MCW8798854.1 glycosyltransferase family 2 protein [Prosthecochloris sp.]